MSFASNVAKSVFGVWEASTLFSRRREILEDRMVRWTVGRRNDIERQKAEVEAATGYPWLHSIFEETFGYPLDLDDPKSFSAKMQWRKIYDRNPLFPVFSDKIAAKHWIREKLGEDLTAPTLFTATAPADLPSGIESRELVLKAAHGSKRHLFIGPDRRLSRTEIRRDIGHKLYKDHSVVLQEWAVSEVPRAILAEPILRDKEGKLTPDTNFHMFGGKLFAIQYNVSSFEPKTGRHGISATVYLDPDWEKIPVRRDRPVADVPERPGCFGHMVEVAETLSADLDYLRVDFFLIDDDFRIGELSIYTSSGLNLYIPMEFDFQMGEQWNLPR
jgi:TupA-like ATPgrasp